MALTCGIVGLPNVGKSTIFNALTAAGIQAENYPFCTIEPNTGVVEVPDPRLKKLDDIVHGKRIVPTMVEFVDIAGLVKGAAQGEGLGNKFLANIRETTALVHVVRCFDDENVIHVDGSTDPCRDVETIEIELGLADIETLEKRAIRSQKTAKSGDKAAKAETVFFAELLEHVSGGKPVRSFDIPDVHQDTIRDCHLLTAKPVLYVANVEEGSVATGNALSERIVARAQEHGAGAVVISAAIEAEVAAFAERAERAEFLDGLGLEETGLNRVIRAGYALLDLITFFTSGPKETRAWTVARGAKAAAAAGTIHSDFERGFIRAETIAYRDFVACGGEQGAKDAGKMRAEGRDYPVKDGDVFHFRFNV
jgi:GTP-binding protein YchF